MVRIEHPVEQGATDEQWRALIRSTGVRIKNDTKPWGPLARRDFLNFLEATHPHRMPVFFESKEAALSALKNRRETAKESKENDVSKATPLPVVQKVEDEQ